MSTIKDVARHAGVSISTVSHVLNGTRFVSEDKTLKVRNAVEVLDTVVYSRSSPDLIPDAVKLRLFHNAHHTSSLPVQLMVV